MQSRARRSRSATAVLVDEHGHHGDGYDVVVSRRGRASFWFVTASNYGMVLEGYQTLKVPMGTQHAKTFGSSATACGIDARGWSKFWDRPFQVLEQGACEACARALGLR